MKLVRPNSAWLAFGLVLLLAGCGFQPVYMPTASGKAGPAQRELAAVNVPLMGDRPGQLFRQALQERLSNDSGTAQHYDLEASFWIAGEGIAINTEDVATRIRLTGHVSWTLRARDAARTRLTSGSGSLVDGLNLLDQQYFAADLENEVIQKRLANALAEQVATQLAIYFRHRAATGG
jgi:LPS-assembly lipoprotein